MMNMMELKDVVVVTKPIEGIYGARINFQGSNEKAVEFSRVCQEIKDDAGLMQNNYTTYEFFHKSRENIEATAFGVADKLKVPVLFM
jgi:hypothetical protein